MFIITFSLNFIEKTHTSLCTVAAIVQLTNPMENSMQVLWQPQFQAPSSGKTNKQTEQINSNNIHIYILKWIKLVFAPRWSLFRYLWIRLKHWDGFSKNLTHHAKKNLKSILNRSLLGNFTKVSEDVSSAHPVYERYNSEKTVKVVHEHKPATLGFFEHLQVDMFN